MKVELKAFNIIDSTVMFGRLSDVEREVYKALTGLDMDPQESTLNIYNSAGMHFSWMVGDDLVAVGGFVRQRPGVLRTWFACPDESWANHGKAITERAHDIIQQLLKEGHAHRIETVTLERHKKACKWYEKIGLRRESVIERGSASGENMVMYVAIAENANVL